MPANFLHGVETVEVTRGPRPIRLVKTAIVLLVGTAPMIDVASADRTLNGLQMVLSDRDAQYFGQNRAGFTIPAALDAIFDQGRGTAVLVVNVLDTATHKTAVADEAGTFSGDVLTLAHSQLPTTPVVKSTDGQITYVVDVDFVVNAADGKLTRKAGGAIAANASVKTSYDWLDPSKVTAADIIGAVDGAGHRTGMQAALDAFSLFGFKPKILIAPGFSTLASVTSELDVLANKLRAIAYVDAPIGITVQQAITGRGPAGAINFNTASNRLMLCYPHLKRYDAATDSTVLEPYSARLAGVRAATDTERGYWWSGSNQEIRGIVGIERPIVADFTDPASEANLLNEAGIVTVYNNFGTGFRTWGNRTAAWPTLTDPKNFECVRRVADVLHESVELAMLQFMDAPLNNAIIDAVAESVSGFMRHLIAQGALIDGRCTYDKGKNPVTELALGHVTFDLDFMPPTPMERVTFESFVDISMLKALGGNG